MVKNLDVVIVLQSGAIEEDFAENILNQRKNTQDRLLWFLPIKGLESRNKSHYRVITDKRTFQINYGGNNEPNWHPYFVINPPTYNDRISHPIYRLSNDPKPEHAILIVDDHRSSGNTIYQTQCALLQLGYQKKDIFSYAHTLDIMSRYELRDSEDQIITREKLFELLQ